MTILERLETTIGNIKFQRGTILWDDLEKLELVVKQLQDDNETNSNAEFRM